MNIKPDVRDVLVSLYEEWKRKDFQAKVQGCIWYLPKPDNQIALNIYESITGKTTTDFIWLKIDQEILSSWINALETVVEE